MIRSLALALIVLGPAACRTMPPAPIVDDYRAIGTEPFWDLTFGTELVFTDRGNGVAVTERPPVRFVPARGAVYRGRRIEVTITAGPCSDGMSDRVYPETVRLMVDGQPYRGCGAGSEFFRRSAP